MVRPRLRLSSSLLDDTNPHSPFAAVTSDGIPFYLVAPARRGLVATILTSIIKLLKANPNPSPATWANVQAAKMYFSNDDEVKKEYRKKVARLVRKSVEGDE